MVPSLTPYDLPFPHKSGFHMPQHTRMAISLQWVIRSTPCLVLAGVGFSGTADRTALFTVRTNQRWRPPPCWKNLRWRYISATGRPIHFMFGYRVGFSGTADLMALFQVRTNSRWRPPLSWIIIRMAISPQRLTIYLYSAHRSLIFAIAQLSCWDMS